MTMTMTMTMTTVDERSASTHADSLRHRVTAGEPVSAAEFAAAEAAERLEQLQREAAEERARRERARSALWWRVRRPPDHRCATRRAGPLPVDVATTSDRS